MIFVKPQFMESFNGFFQVERRLLRGLGLLARAFQRLVHLAGQFVQIGNLDLGARCHDALFYSGRRGLKTCVLLQSLFRLLPEELAEDRFGAPDSELLYRLSGL